jgi:hypothetical protein
MPDWTTLNEEWLERTRRLLQRSVKELDMTKAQQLRHAASNSESNRREWRYACWQAQSET